MGKRNRDAVREWSKVRPPHLDEEARRRVEAIVGSNPRPQDLAALAHSIITAAARASEPVPGIHPSGEGFEVTPPESHAMERPCFRCRHPVGIHGEDSDCPCCKRGLKIISKGTNLLDLALKEQWLRRIP
jgi:hypothetical protein